MLTLVADAPRHETPNAVMRTHAAPSLGSSELSVWEVTMATGQRGPLHEADREQVWVVLSGELRVEIDAEALVVRPGDSLCLPRDTSRQVAAITDVRAIVASSARPVVTTVEGCSRPLPWAA
jgi:quercetin dioxygenase-like cupin family protein